MANQNGRPIAPARKLVAAVVGTIAVFVMLFGLGMSSWAIVALGLAMLILAIGLGMVNVVRRGARAWVAGSAQVKSVSEPPATAIYGRAELQIVIVAPGLPTSEVTVRDPRVPVAKWPRVGDTLPVTVDVDDMRRVRINWDEAEAYETTTFNVPPAYYDEDLPDDDLLGGEPEPPPWATRDRQWGRGPDEPPPPPPPAPRTGDLDGPPPPPRAGLMEESTSSVIVRDAPGGPIVEGHLVEPDYDYPSPLPQRARTATATPPRPAEKPRPRPRPRPHATATPDPETAEGTHPEPPEAAAEPVPAAAPSASPVSPVSPAAGAAGEGAAPAQRASTGSAAAAGPVYDSEIDLPLDGDPEPAPETKPAARAAVDQDILAAPAAGAPDSAAPPAAEASAAAEPSSPAEPSSAQDRAGRILDTEDAPPRARSADDDLLGDLEPPPWAVRAQQAEAAPEVVPPAAEPVSPAPPVSTASPVSVAEARPAAESRQPPRPRPSASAAASAASSDTPQAARPAGESDRPRRAAQSTGLAAAAGAAVAAGMAALSNAFRAKKQEAPRPSSDAAPLAAQRPEPAFSDPARSGPAPASARPASARPEPARPPGAAVPKQAVPPSETGPFLEDDLAGATGAVSAAHSAAEPTTDPATEPVPPTEPAAAPRAATEPTAAPQAVVDSAVSPGPDSAAAAGAAVPKGEPDSARPAAEARSGQVYAAPTAFGPGGGSGTGALADTGPRREPTPVQRATVYRAGAAGEPIADSPPPAPRRGKPWADLEGGFEPDERADDVITAYPSARPGPAGAIHGVGITVLVTDLDRSVAFYREMLGFYTIDTGSGSAVLASGDTRLVLRTVRDLSGAASRLVYLNLEVGDVDAVYEDLKRKGVTFVHGPRSVNRGDKLELWAASFHDPDKHNIAITQWRAIR